MAERGGGGIWNSSGDTEEASTHVSGTRVTVRSTSQVGARHAAFLIFYSHLRSYLSISFCRLLDLFVGMRMDSEVAGPLVENINAVAENPLTRLVLKESVPTKNNQRKVPRRVHKAVREKLKREHLNDLFHELADALDLNHQNTGKAFILREAIRIVKDTIAQMECLRTENAALCSESHFVNMEKSEIRDENSVLAAQIETLQTEIKARATLYKPGLNLAPSELTQHFPGSSLRFPHADQAVQKSPVVGPVLVMPLASDIQAFPDSDIPRSIPMVSKPHARYPTPGDSWPSQVLGAQPTAGKESELSS